MADYVQFCGRINSSENLCGISFRFDIVCHSMINMAKLASK